MTKRKAKRKYEEKSVDTCATTTIKTKVVILRAEPKSIGIRALKPTC